MDRIAEEYVKLTLAIGQHDPNYVDAYYGPEDWAADVKAAPPSLESILERAGKARSDLDSVSVDGIDLASKLRRRFLAKQIDAMIARTEMLGGARWTFDQESAALYDVVAPRLDDAYFAGIIANLEESLPGSDPLCDRYERFRSEFVVPADKLPTVFSLAIDEARQRTKRFIDLAEGEDFRIEYVTGEVWSAYNWYQGQGRSLIQVNTDLPFTIDRAVHLAAHEGYPGHHVYNALLEEKLARERNWVEFTVYPLYSPQSLIAEGTAEYGVELAFPGDEKQEFEREVLFPAAGLDPDRAEEFARIQALFAPLSGAGNQAARRFLDGEATREQTIEWLTTYTATSPARAAQRVRFFEAHRSYTVTYDLGLGMVREAVEARADSLEGRWRVFTHVLSTPQVPSGLR